MPALNLFKRNTDKPRLTIRERFRNAAARVMPRSGGSRPGGMDASRRALMAGSLASVASASLPVAAEAGSESDAALLEAWAKYQAAWAEVRAIGQRDQPLYEAALAALPEHPFDVALAAGKHPPGTTMQALPTEEWEAYEAMRHRQYEEAWDKAGLRSKERELDRLYEAMEPLANIITSTIPTTLEGVAAKARYHLECGGSDWEPLLEFVEELAGLSSSAATHH